MLVYTSRTFLESITLKILPNDALKRRKLLNLPNFSKGAYTCSLLPYTPFLGKNAFISIVFNQKLVFLVSIFSKLHENTLTVSLKFLQENIIIRNTLSSKNDCLRYLLPENMVLPVNIYVIIMPILKTLQSPECTKLHHLKTVFQPLNPLAI